MDNRAILDELLNILSGHQVHIRTESMGGCGTALCKLRDKYVFFNDTDAAVGDSAAICADAVNRLINVEDIYLRPEIRDFLEKNQPDE